MKDYPSKELLLELAKICKSVYGAPINHRIMTINGSVLQHQRIIHGALGGGICRIFWNDEHVVIAFRGTLDSSDWRISNLKIFPALLKKCDESGNIRVHLGFQNSLYYEDKTTKESSINAICKHLEEEQLISKGRNVIITGHSLGGALATLFAVNLRSETKCNVNIKSIVLFGSPAVGFRKFKTFYGDLESKTIRIINGSDIVPFTPPILYRHVGRSIWLNNGKIFARDNWVNRFLHSLKLPINRFLKDHPMESYIDTIKKANFSS